MVQVEYNREKGEMDKYAVNTKGERNDSFSSKVSGIDNTKFYPGVQHWEAMSYPEFKDAIVGDPILAGYEQNTVAYLIRHTLTDNYPSTSPAILGQSDVDLAQRKIDGLTLAMFGLEVIRNAREMTIQLMFLDLVQAREYWRNADKGYTIARALTREVTNRRSTYNDTQKGGKLLSMATGSAAQGRERNFLTSNPLNQVEQKDVTIMIHWLEHTLLFPYVVDENSPIRRRLSTRRMSAGPPSPTSPI